MIYKQIINTTDLIKACSLFNIRSKKVYTFLFWVYLVTPPTVLAEYEFLYSPNKLK